MFGWGGTFLLWGILSSLIAMFTFGNIAPVASAMFLNVNIAQRKTAGARLLEVLELIRRKGERNDEAFARLRCGGDVDAHFGA